MGDYKISDDKVWQDVTDAFEGKLAYRFNERGVITIYKESKERGKYSIDYNLSELNMENALKLLDFYKNNPEQSYTKNSHEEHTSAYVCSLLINAPKRILEKWLRYGIDSDTVRQLQDFVFAYGDGKIITLWISKTKEQKMINIEDSNVQAAIERVLVEGNTQSMSIALATARDKFLINLDNPIHRRGVDKILQEGNPVSKALLLFKHGQKTDLGFVLKDPLIRQIIFNILEEGAVINVNAALQRYVKDFNEFAKYKRLTPREMAILPIAMNRACQEQDIEYLGVTLSKWTQYFTLNPENPIHKKVIIKILKHNTPLPTVFCIKSHNSMKAFYEVAIKMKEEERQKIINQKIEMVRGARSKQEFLHFIHCIKQRKYTPCKLLSKVDERNALRQIISNPNPNLSLLADDHREGNEPKLKIENTASTSKNTNQGKVVQKSTNPKSPETDVKTKTSNFEGTTNTTKASIKPEIEIQNKQSASNPRRKEFPRKFEKVNRYNKKASGKLNNFSKKEVKAGESQGFTVLTTLQDRPSTSLKFSLEINQGPGKEQQISNIAKNRKKTLIEGTTLTHIESEKRSKQSTDTLSTSQDEPSTSLKFSAKTNQGSSKEQQISNIAKNRKKRINKISRKERERQTIDLLIERELRRRRARTYCNCAIL